MSRAIRFKKQYKPMGFGDAPDPRTVEGHQAAMQEAAETRRYNRRMKELVAEDERRKPGLVTRFLRFMRITRRWS
jgi:hypothetical protein